MVKQTETFGQLNLLADFCTTPLHDFIITPKHPKYSQFLTNWQACKYFTLDIETQGVKSLAEGLDHYRGKIRLIQIKVYQHPEVLLVDMNEEVPITFLETLKQTLWSEKQHSIGHNIQFDLTWIRHHLGFKTRNPYCTRILSILVNCGIKWIKKTPMRHGLKDVCKRLDIGLVDKTEQKSDWSQPKLSNDQINYAVMDVIYTEQAFIKMSHQLMSYKDMKAIDGMPCRYTPLEILQIECFAIPAMCEIVLTGQPVDIEYALQVKQQYVDAVDSIYSEVNLPVSWSASSDKLCVAIFDAFNIWLLQEKSFKELSEEDESDEDEVKLTQLRMFGKQFPEVPAGYKLSTGSANLFAYYTKTNNEALLRISICRTLKKCIDSLDALIDSAKQNNGYAKGRYTSLGNTGSGRSTCSGDNKSSLSCTNLQNIAGSSILEHPLVAAFNLPAVRAVITNNQEKGMWLMDLSALN